MHASEHNFTTTAQRQELGTKQTTPLFAIYAQTYICLQATIAILTPKGK